MTDDEPETAEEFAARLRHASQGTLIGYLLTLPGHTKPVPTNSRAQMIAEILRLEYPEERI